MKKVAALALCLMLSFVAVSSQAEDGSVSFLPGRYVVGVDIAPGLWSITGEEGGNASVFFYADEAHADKSMFAFLLSLYEQDEGYSPAVLFLSEGCVFESVAALRFESVDVEGGALSGNGVVQ